MKKYLYILAFVLCFSTPAMSATVDGIADTPAPVVDRSTPVLVEHEGSDSLGARLAMRLKENLNTSNLFKLEEADVPKFRIFLSTVPEFKDRPSVGSAYALVWVFSQSDATLKHYIGREVGVFTLDEVDALAAKILERTDGFAVRYAYLFQDN